MPIQWSGTITSPEQLASVIQGESSTSEGQFGVASVIYNRLQAGAAGGVSDSLSGVVTPGNFNGYNSNPSSYAQQLANDIWNGNAPSGGSTGNALYFAAPSTSNAAWANPNTASGQGLFANGTNLGGNYYSDQMGPPSVNFQAPSFGGASSSVYGGVDPITGESGFASDASSDVVGGANTNGIFNNLDNNIFDGGTSPGGIGSDAVAGGTAGAPDASSVDWSDVPDNAFDGSTAASGVAGGTSPISPSGMTGISSSGAVGTQGSVGTIGAGGGIAVDLTDESGLPSSVSGAGTAAKSGLTTAGSDVQSAAGGIVGTLASTINSAETYTSRAFVMIALVVMGAIFVAFGLGLFGKRQLAAITA